MCFSQTALCIASVIMYMTIILVRIYCPVIQEVLAQNQATQVAINHLTGDQTTGGINFFEFHTPAGWIGLGTKLLFVAAIAALIGYYCICRKVKKAIHRASNTLPTVAPIVAPETTAVLHLASLLAGQYEIGHCHKPWALASFKHIKLSLQPHWLNVPPHQSHVSFPGWPIISD